MEGTQDHPLGEQLLDTSPEDVRDDVRDEVARACASIPEVRAAYVVRVKRRFTTGALRREALHVGYELSSPPVSAKDARAMHHVSIALLRALPDHLSKNGVHMLAEAALPAWRRRGLQVYERSER